MKRLGRLTLRILGLGFTLWALGFAALLTTSFLWPRDAEMPARADAIICLGGGMSLLDWQRPGPASSRRALTCAELYRAGVAEQVVFTGYGHEVMSAAQAMANLAAEHGVPEAAILVEPDAQSTIQNAAFSLSLLTAPPARVVVVSDSYHLPRSWLIFQVLGDGVETALYASRLDYTPRASPNARSHLQWVFRESFAIWANLARAAAYFGGGLIGIDRETRIMWFN